MNNIKSDKMPKTNTMPTITMKTSTFKKTMKTITIITLMVISYMIGCINIPLYSAESYVSWVDTTGDGVYPVKKEKVDYCLHGLKIIECKSVFSPLDNGWYDSLQGVVK